MSELIKHKITVREFVTTICTEFKDIDQITDQNRDLASNVGIILFGNEVMCLKAFALNVATSLGLLGNEFRENVLDEFHSRMRLLFEEEGMSLGYSMISFRIEEYDRAVRQSVENSSEGELAHRIEYAAANRFAEFLGMEKDAFVIMLGFTIFMTATNAVTHFIENMEIVSL